MQIKTPMSSKAKRQPHPVRGATVGEGKNEVRARGILNAPIETNPLFPHEEYV